MISQKLISILLVDDHPVVLEGLKALLESSGTMKVCGETGDGNTALELVRKNRPDVIVLDLSLEGADGFVLIERMKALAPTTPILVLSIHDERIHAPRALRAGARGYVMKKELTRHIMNAIQEVATGELYLSDTMKRHLLQSLTAPSRTGSLQTLTQREFQVLQLYGQGLSTAEIAEKLNLSRKTIETYNLRIRKKMQLRSFYELIALGSKFAP